jgi:hypothetical protein|tara:strand:+ start:1175 stop:1348 length:174 start_codon:yes stop_codon:yes gene_type:complete
MEVTSAKYFENKDGEKTGIDTVFNGVERLDVPLDPDNRHYVAILKWVAAGNTITAAD